MYAALSRQVEVGSIPIGSVWPKPKESRSLDVTQGINQCESGRSPQLTNNGATMSRERNLAEFVRPNPGPGVSPDVRLFPMAAIIAMNYRRLSKLSPSETRWLDDDVLTDMERAVYVDVL